MKKWLIRCLTVLAMVCLIPGIVLNVKAADYYIYTYCFVCTKQTICEILGYIKADSNNHRVHIKCTICGRENEIIYGNLSRHTGGTQTPTCITGKICEKCGAEYGILGHDWGAWTPNGNGTHTGSTDCRKFTFRTAEGETLIFCPVCGQAENAAQLEKIEAATAWALSGSLSAEDVTARTNGEYLSVAFETAGSLTQPTGRVRLALPAKLLEGKKLVRIAPDGTQTELPFEAKNGKLIFTLDFANSELPVMLFRLLPQTAAL